MKNKRVGFILLLIFNLIIFIATDAVYAYALPPGEKCSVTVDLSESDLKTVSGIEVDLFRIRTGGSFTPDFADCGFTEEQLYKKDAAAKLYSHAKKKKLPDDLTEVLTDKGKKGTTGSDGRLKIDTLEPGIYLIATPADKDGYYSFEPFLVLLPEVIKGVETKNVTVKPKAINKPTPTPVPTTTPKVTPTPQVTPGPTPTPTVPVTKTLIKTGQLNWPEPVLAASGMIFIMVGVLIRKKNGNESDEER